MPRSTHCVLAVAVGLGLVAGWPTHRIDSAAAEREAVGFQRRSIVGSDGVPIPIGVWYPTRSAAAPASLGMFEQEVALDAAVDGTALPLIVISHGTQGSMASHYDTALELARGGFVVVAPTHPGDNVGDQSQAGKQRNLLDRPRQIRDVVTYMLSVWPGRDHLDSSRIGMLGVSLGGFTGLVIAGGSPDLRLTRQRCVAAPDAPECRFIRSHGSDPLEAVSVPPTAWVHDQRIRALVIAVPAIGYLFADSGLRRVMIPVQLWRATADSEAPNDANSDVIRRALPRSPEVHTIDGAGHFVFLAPCSASLAAVAPRICHDPPGVDRHAVHADWSAAVRQFFTTALVRSNE